MKLKKKVENTIYSKVYFNFNTQKEARANQKGLKLVKEDRE